MAAVWLIVATLVGAGLEAGTEVSALVAKLSAPRRADRDRAARALEAIGEAAAPALREAAGSRNLEVRRLASAALDAIEGRALARPTPVRLDFRDRPVAEVVDAIAARTGLGLVLDAQADPKHGVARITLEAPAPVDFWEAVDRLGTAAGLRVDGSANAGWNRNINLGGPGGFGRRIGPQPARRTITPGDVVLVPDLGGVRTPTALAGRFRIEVTGLHLKRDRTLGAAGDRPTPDVVAERFEVRLRLTPEPGLVVGKVGDPEASEAIDDRGHSLLGASAKPEAVPFYDQSGGRGTPASLRLRYPDDPGASITRLSGIFRVTVVGGRPDPVVASLVDRLGTPSMKGGVALTVHSVKPAAEGGAARLVELSLSLPGAAGASAPMAMYQNRPANVPPPSAHGWIEFVDAEGRTVERVAASNGYTVGFGAAGSPRRTLRVAPVEGVGPAVAVRYVGATWTTLDVPFAFRDLPMP